MVTDVVNPTLGALQRPAALAATEDRYRLLKTTPLAKPDMSAILLWLIQFFTDVEEDQDGLGACASWAACEAAEATARIARYLVGASMDDVQRMHRLAVYEMARKLDNFWPEDSGSYLARNLDIMMEGAPAESAAPYRFQADFEYASGIWDDRKTRDYVKSHRPFYPSEGNFLENCTAAIQGDLDNGITPMVVNLGSYWPNQWFSPDAVTGCIEPGAVFDPRSTGGHSYLLVARIPPYMVCNNHWTRNWNRAAAQHWGGYGVKPGWFLIHEDYFKLPPQLTPFFEARAISLEPVPTPEPKPGPEPGPEPGPQPTPPSDAWQKCAEAMHEAAHHGDMDALIAIRNAIDTSAPWGNDLWHMADTMVRAAESIRDNVEAAWQANVPS